MEITELELSGVKLIQNFYLRDERGLFCKTFHIDSFLKNGLLKEIKESYYSVSQKGVVRGMHFQVPPNQHNKLVSIIDGTVLDVIIDLRKSSPTYGKTIGIELDDQGKSIYIPKGFAHGFKVLSKSATMLYMQDSVYHPPADKGILWSSIDFDWNIKNPILSERDQSFPALNDFNSPFL